MSFDKTFSETKRDKFSFGKSSRFPSLGNKHTIDASEKKSHHNNNISFRNASNLSFYNDTGNPFENIERKTSSKGIPFAYGGDLTHNGNSNAEYHKIFKKDNKRQVPAVDKSLVHKKKSPSCVIVGKHAQDSFLYQITDLLQRPSPANYKPNDTIKSRRKNSPSIKFTSARRFNYDIDNFDRMIGPGKYF